MPSIYNDADVAAALSGPDSVSVTLGGATSRGTKEDVDEVVLREHGIVGIMNKTITVLLQTSAFPALVSENAIGLPITVDGAAYSVVGRLRIDDGAMTHVICSSQS